MYAHGFRFYFTPLAGVLFAFPSRYWFTIGRSGVFSLGGWSPHIQTGFHVPRLTHHHLLGPFTYRAITFYGRPFQAVLLEPNRLQGWSPFARHYWGNLGSFLFLRVLRCFSSTGSLPYPMYSVRVTPCGVVFPIRTSPDQCLLPTPRSFSQAATSFIASDRQGIHRVRLFA